MTVWFSAEHALKPLSEASLYCAVEMPPPGSPALAAGYIPGPAACPLTSGGTPVPPQPDVSGHLSETPGEER